MKLFLTKIFHKYPVIRLLFLIFLDVSFVALSVTLGFLLRFDGVIPPQYLAGSYRAIIGLLVLFTIPIFAFFRLYSFSWSYVSVSELVMLAGAVFSSFTLAGLVLLGFREESLFLGFPRSVLFISATFLFFLSGGVRFAKRVFEEIASFQSRKKGVRTLIVGAGDAGAILARNMVNSSPYALMGFVDDDRLKLGSHIHGVRVLGSIDDIPAVISAYKVEEMVIALPSAGSSPIRQAVEHGRSVGLTKIKVVPPLSEIMNGEISLRNLREVQMEDLLGRDAVSLDFGPIEEYTRGKTVLITGAAGSIGSELVRQISRFQPSSLILLDQDETGIFHIERELLEHSLSFPFVAVIADIRDEGRMKRVFAKHRPNVVFHAAAYKHVPLMEYNIEEAIRNNVFGTLTLANIALETHVEKFIFISTDKAINPTSVMGAAKRLGEMICQVLNQKNHTRFLSVRFGNVLASRGSVIHIFREQIKRGGPVTVTHPEMKRYFMSTSEACQLVMLAGSFGEGGEVYVLDMGQPIKIVDLARELIRLSGFEPDQDIPIVFSGMRPGEKLFEELLGSEEGVIATEHQKIWKARLSLVAERELFEGLELLKQVLEDGDHEETRAVLGRLVPSYTPHRHRDISHV